MTASIFGAEPGGATSSRAQAPRRAHRAGINRTAAGEIARVQRAAILKGEVGIGGPKRADVTIEKAAELFMAWAEANKRPRTIDTYRRCIARVARAFAGRRLGEISAFDLERYKRARVDAGVTVLVNRELAWARSTTGVGSGGTYEGENPAGRVKPLRESRGRLRFLETTEEARLLEAAPEPLPTMILVGSNAGLRLLSEALSSAGPTSTWSAGS